MDAAAFTLIEVLMASIIFILTVGGVFATLNAVRAPVAQNVLAVSASTLGKQVLEALHSQVNTLSGAGQYYGLCTALNADNSCPDFSLSLGQHKVPVANVPGINLNTLPSDFASSNPDTNNPANLNGVVGYTVSCSGGQNPGNVSGNVPANPNNAGNPPSAGCAASPDDISRTVILQIKY